MTDLFNSGIRPAIDDYLLKKSQEVRDYGDYWSASSAGYCMRKLIFERLGVPPVEKDSDARKTRVFEAGHVFHAWVQNITKNAGLSVAQELELQDEDLMVRGHIDDLVLIPDTVTDELGTQDNSRLILYDYKTQHSGAFTWQKGREASHYHRMQVGTYMYMLRKNPEQIRFTLDSRVLNKVADSAPTGELSEARILKISKDDLRMDENQVLWSDERGAEVMDFWVALNGYWKARKIPRCTCAEHEGGFMAREAFNPYYFDGQPCSLKYYQNWKASKVKETKNVK